MTLRPPLDPHDLIPEIAAGTRKVIRQSYMGDFDVCPRRLGFNLDRTIPKGSSESRIVGTAYHAGLECLYTVRSELDAAEVHPAAIEGAAHEAFDREAEGFTGWDTSREEARKRVTALLDRYLVDNCAWPDTWAVVGVEQEWFLPLSDQYVIKGTIDLVLRDRNEGTLVLADHKTAGKRWPQNKEHARKNQQAVLYCWAWWACTGEMPDGFAFDIMTYGGVFERRWSHPTSDHMHNVLGKALGICSVLEAVPAERLPANTSSALCSAKYCDYWQLCPFGQSAE